MYTVDYMTNIGQHEMTIRHPHFKAIYNYLPKDIIFHDTTHDGEDNENYYDYLSALEKKSKELGASTDDINYFVSKIHPNCSKQKHSSLYFVPAHPYFGNEPHILAFEYWLTYYTYSLEPYITKNIKIDIRHINWNKVTIAAMLQPSFKALCVHMHDTINTFKFITEDFPELHHKFVYLPLASIESNKVIEPKVVTTTFNVLFTNSYGGQYPGFLARGGKESIMAIAQLLDKYANLRFITIGPTPLFNHPQIIQYPSHISDELYDSIIQDCHIFLLPSMQLHSISLVKAMCNGIIPIVSDGWGFDEFVTHEHNGFIVKGQNGYTTKKDEYNLLQLLPGSAAPHMAQNIYNILEKLLNNTNDITRLSNNCLTYARANFNIENRNKILNKVIKENYE